MPLPRSRIGKRSRDRDYRVIRTALNLPVVVGAGGGVTDHGDLTGLADDDHANYLHLTAARTIQAQHSFSPASSQAPFGLGTNAQGQLVTGLRADQLDKDVIAGTLLTGGGTLTSDVTLNVDEASIDHGNLAGLSDDDHPQYAAIAQAETISGAWAFTSPVAITTTAEPQLTITDPSGNSTFTQAAHLTIATDAGDILFAPAGGDTYVNTGQFGIGGLPSYPLHVKSTAVYSTSLTYDATHYARIGVNSTGRFTIDVVASAYGDIWLQPEAGTGKLVVTEAARFSGGLVSIGTLNPSYPLHIQSTTQPQVRIENDASNYATLSVNPSGNIAYVSIGGEHMFEKSNATMVYVGLRATAGNARSFRFYTSTLNRWIVGADSTAESGSNVGSDFEIQRYNDAGVQLDIPFKIVRSTGELTLLNDLQLAANLDFVTARNITTTTGDLFILPADDLIITPASTYTKITGYLQFQGAGEISTTSGDLTLSPNGDLIFDPVGSFLFSASLIPTATDTYDVGSSVKLWRTGFFSELEALLFVENSIHVEAGWLIVGHGQGTIEADVNDTTDTTVDLGIDETKIDDNDFILFRAYLQVEYMKIVSQVGGAGTTVWNVTRDVDGTGKNWWYEGSVFLVLGNTGDGRIELVASQNDAPRISLINQGATYNAQTEYFRVGNLRDSYSIGSTDTYGMGFGDYNSQSYIQVTATEGIEFFDDSSVQVGQLKGEIWTIGQIDASHKHVRITADAIQFMEDTTIYGSLSGSEWMIGNEASEKVVITASAVEFQDGSDNVHMRLSGTTITVGQIGQEHIELTSTELNFKNSTVIRGSLSGDVWMLGAQDSEKVVITTTAVQFQDDSDNVHAQLTGTTLTMGQTDREHIELTSTELNFKNSAAIMGSLSSTTWTLGAASSEQVVITTTAIQMKDQAGNVQVSLDGGATPVLTLGYQTGHEYVTVSSSGIEMFSNDIKVIDLDASGNVVFGQVATNQGNMYWNNSSKILQFRGGTNGTSVQATVSTTGAITAGGGAVTIDAGGIGLGIPSSKTAQNTIQWLEGTTERASIYGVHLNTVYILLGLVATSPSGENATVSLTADATVSTDQANVQLSARRDTNSIVLDLIANNSNNQYAYLHVATGTFAGFHVGGVTVPSYALQVTGTFYVSSVLRTGNDARIVGGLAVGSGTLNNANGMANITGGLRVGDSTAPTDNDIYATGDIFSANAFYVNDTVNTKQGRGLTLNQGGYNDEIVSLKSSLVDHGLDAETEVDTFCLMKKMYTTGGLKMLGLSVGYTGMFLFSAGSLVETGKSSSNGGMFKFTTQKNNSGTFSALGTNGNLFSWHGYAGTKMILDEEGELHLKATLYNDAHYGHVYSLTDDYDDIALLNGLRGALAPKGHELRERFAKFIDYARPVLEEHRVISFNDGPGEDGVPFVAIKQLAMLTIDAVRQFYDRQMQVNDNIHEELRRVYAKMYRYEGALLKMGADPKLLEG